MSQNKQLNFDFLIAAHDASGEIALLEFEHSVFATATPQDAANAPQCVIDAQLALFADAAKTEVLPWQK